MSDTTLARAAFDARLHELKLHDLASHEIDRLWKSRLKQLEISARLDSHLDPTLEAAVAFRSEEHTSELQSLMRISYAVFCLKKKTTKTTTQTRHTINQLHPHNTTPKKD